MISHDSSTYSPPKNGNNIASAKELDAWREQFVEYYKEIIANK